MSQKEPNVNSLPSDNSDLTSTLNDIVSMIDTTSGSAYKLRATAKSINFRCPVTVFSYIDAIASHTDSSRTKIVVALIEAGIEEVLHKLDPEKRLCIENLRLDILNQIMAKTKNSEFELFDSEER